MVRICSQCEARFEAGDDPDMDACDNCHETNPGYANANVAQFIDQCAVVPFEDEPTQKMEVRPLKVCLYSADSMEDLMTTSGCMIVCRRCQAYFDPDDTIQATCDTCCEEDARFAHVASAERMEAESKLKKEIPLQGLDANWCPLTSEEEERFYQKADQSSLN